MKLCESIARMRSFHESSDLIASPVDRLYSFALCPKPISLSLPTTHTEIPHEPCKFSVIKGEENFHAVAFSRKKIQRHKLQQMKLYLYNKKYLTPTHFTHSFSHSIFPVFFLDFSNTRGGLFIVKCV